MRSPYRVDLMIDFMFDAMSIAGASAEGSSAAAASTIMA